MALQWATCSDVASVELIPRLRDVGWSPSNRWWKEPKDDPPMAKQATAARHQPLTDQDIVLALKSLGLEVTGIGPHGFVYRKAR